jgi:hypothetical protein
MRPVNNNVQPLRRMALLSGIAFHPVHRELHNDPVEQDLAPTSTLIMSSLARFHIGLIPPQAEIWTELCLPEKLTT